MPYTARTLLRFVFHFTTMRLQVALALKTAIAHGTLEVLMQELFLQLRIYEWESTLFRPIQNGVSGLAVMGEFIFRILLQ